MGLAEVLTAIFVTLKLTHVIAWSWWAVVSPELISIGFVLLALLGIVGAAVKSIK